VPGDFEEEVEGVFGEAAAALGEGGGELLVGGRGGPVNDELAVGVVAFADVADRRVGGAVGGGLGTGAEDGRPVGRHGDAVDAEDTGEPGVDIGEVAHDPEGVVVGG